VRLFLAINFPPAVRTEIAAATAGLRALAPEVAWVDEPLLHLTLKFLDEQPEERLDAIQAGLAEVAARHREPLLALGGIGAFPNFRRARIVWMGVVPEPRLELLHHDLEVAFEALGFEVDGRPFRPHLTLGRVKHALPEERLRELARTAKRMEYRTDFIVHSIDLVQSTLGRGGPSYATLVSAALRSG
jgi:RNA 2',3'-cyclic 3'-phosphodiesterase